MTDLTKKPEQKPEKKQESQTPASSPFGGKTEAFNVQKKENTESQDKTSK